MESYHKTYSFSFTLLFLISSYLHIHHWCLGEGRILESAEDTVTFVGRICSFIPWSVKAIWIKLRTLAELLLIGMMCFLPVQSSVISRAAFEYALDIFLGNFSMLGVTLGSRMHCACLEWHH